jgi:Zn-dependent protease with chaperone function
MFAAWRQNFSQSRVGKILHNYYFLHFVRAIRIGSLGVVIYQSGKTSGIIEYAQNPKAMELELEKGIINSTRGEIVDVNSSEHERISRVTDKVLDLAEKYCTNSLSLATKAVSEARIARRNHQLAIGAAELDKKLEVALEQEKMFKERLARIKGQWQLKVINSNVPNAFVTGITPRKIYVLTGLLSVYDPSDDELAMTLAHEISHCILAHSGQKSEDAAIFAVLQMVIMTFVDPTGIFSYAFDGIVAKLCEFLLASNSRVCEEEADDMGLEILATDCTFDLVGGANIFAKFSQKEDHAHDHDWERTHPPSQERFEKLVAKSKILQSEQRNNCAAYKESFLSSIFGSSKEPHAVQLVKVAK